MKIKIADNSPANLNLSIPQYREQGADDSTTSKLESIAKTVPAVMDQLAGLQSELSKRWVNNFGSQFLRDQIIADNDAASSSELGETFAKTQEATASKRYDEELKKAPFYVDKNIAESAKQDILTRRFAANYELQVSVRNIKQIDEETNGVWNDSLIVMTHPETFTETLKKRLESIDSTQVEPGKKIELKSLAREKLSETLVKHAIATAEDPEVVLTSLQNGSFAKIEGFTMNQQSTNAIIAASVDIITRKKQVLVNKYYTALSKNKPLYEDGKTDTLLDPGMSLDEAQKIMNPEQFATFTEKYNDASASRQSLDSIGKDSNENKEQSVYSAAFWKNKDKSPAIVEIQKAANEADVDPILLPLVAASESGFIVKNGVPTINLNPPKGKDGEVGVWQFMEDTGKNFGLKSIDRADFKKSTKAAVLFFKELKDRFNNNVPLMLVGYKRGVLADKYKKMGLTTWPQIKKQLIADGQLIATRSIDQIMTVYSAQYKSFASNSKSLTGEHTESDDKLLRESDYRFATLHPAEYAAASFEDKVVFRYESQLKDGASVGRMGLISKDEARLITQSGESHKLIGNLEGKIPGDAIDVIKATLVDKGGEDMSFTVMSDYSEPDYIKARRLSDKNGEKSDIDWNSAVKKSLPQIMEQESSGLMSDSKPFEIMSINLSITSGDPNAGVKWVQQFASAPLKELFYYNKSYDSVGEDGASDLAERSVQWYERAYSLKDINPNGFLVPVNRKYNLDSELLKSKLADVLELGRLPNGKRFYLRISGKLYDSRHFIDNDRYFWALAPNRAGVVLMNVQDDINNDGEIDDEDIPGSWKVKTTISNQLYVGFDDMDRISAMKNNVIAQSKKPKAQKNGRTRQRIS